MLRFSRAWVIKGAYGVREMRLRTRQEVFCAHFLDMDLEKMGHHDSYLCLRDGYLGIGMLVA